ncbi:hypothetical protein UQW22_06290 [Isoptericola halotolerans]|uniref:hypothetical protein n=1 Tax=Isoptericola halotolerans TaxID=300560 RepID=UPI003890ABE9
MTDPYQPPQPSSTPGGEPAPGQQGSEQPQGPSQPAPGYGQQSGAQPGYQQPGPPPGSSQQPGYQQPGYPPAGYQQPGYPPPYPPDPPGKTMGIIGFVLAFVIAPAGIVVSAMALSESKKAGYDNVLGKWGLWLSIIFTSLCVLVVLAYVVFAIALFGTVATSVNY